MNLSIHAIFDFLAESNRIEGYQIHPIHYMEQWHDAPLSKSLTNEHRQLVKTSCASLRKVIELANRAERLTKANLCEIQGILMEGLLPPKYVGVYRPDEIRVEIAGRLTAIGDEFAYQEQEFFDHFNNSKDHTLDDIQYRHFMFEYWHPFVDGNGRTGRLLWLWDCIRNNYAIHRHLSQFQPLTHKEYQPFATDRPIPDDYWESQYPFEEFRQSYYAYLKRMGSQMSHARMKEYITNEIIKKFNSTTIK